MRWKWRMMPLVLILFLFIPAPVRAAAKPVQEVLLLTSYTLSQQWTFDVVQALKSTGKTSGLDIRYDPVELDAMYRDPQEWQDKFNQKAERLKNHQYDLVIALDTEAAELIRRNAGLLAPTPVILADHSEETPVFGPEYANFTGVFWSSDLRRTIDTGRKLMPDTAAVYILTDATPAGERCREYWYRQLADYTGCPLVFLSGTEYSSQQLIAKIRSSGIPGFAILTPWHDLYRNDQSLPAFAADLEQSLNRPFFGCTGNWFGCGLLGGYLAPADKLGTAVGQQMNAILADPEAPLPAPRRCETIPVFDYELLRKFNLNPGALPSDAILRNRPLSLWDIYGTEIRLAGVGILLCFGGALGYLYVLHRKLRDYRKLAEAHRRDLLQLQENTQLWDTAVNELPVFFFIKDAGRDFQYLETNQPWRDFLRRGKEDIHDKTDYSVFPHEIAEAIRQDDQKPIRANTLREDTLTIPDADGKKRCLRFLRQPFILPSGKRLLLGMAIDITEP